MSNNINEYVISYRWIGYEELQRKGEPYGYNYSHYNTHRNIIDETFDAGDEDEAIAYGMDFIEADLYSVFKDGIEVYNPDINDYEDRDFYVDVDYIDQEIRVLDSDTRELIEIYTDFKAEIVED